MVLELLANALAVVIVTVLAWWGAGGLRGLAQFSASHTLDVTASAPAPPGEVEALTGLLKAWGFEPLGVVGSGRPILKQRAMAWVLADPARTTLAEVGVVSNSVDVVHAFTTVLADGTVLATASSFPHERDKPPLVMRMTSGNLEESWRRHQAAAAALTPVHGPPHPQRSMNDALRTSAMARARLASHGFGLDRPMFVGWLAGALIVWGALVVTGALGPADLEAWLRDLRWPMIIGLLVAVVPALANLRRLLALR